MRSCACVHFRVSRYEHYVALGAFAEDCAALHAAWSVAAPGAPPAACAVHSEPWHGSLADVDIHLMWAARYAFLHALLGTGLNVLMIDADVAIHGDVYSVLHGPCLREAALVLHSEPVGGHSHEESSYPNGGFIYARGGRPHGAVAWLLHQVPAGF